MAVNLSPVGGVAAQFLDNNGNVLSGGKLYTYSAGTTTPAATFTSSLGITTHTNPIVLDAAGRVPSGEIWLTDGVIYKFVLKTSADVLIATYDNITGINSNFVNFTAQQEIQTATAGQTVFDLTTMQYQPGTNSLTVYVDGVNQYGPGSSYAYLETDSDTVTFVSGLHEGAEVKFTTTTQTSGNATDASVVTYDPPFTGGVATTVEAKLAQTVSVKDFGAVGDGVTDDTAAIQAACDYLQQFAGAYNSVPGSGELIFPSSNGEIYATSGGITLPECRIVGENTYIKPLGNPAYIFKLNLRHNTNSRRFTKNWYFGGFRMWSNRGFGVNASAPDCDHLLVIDGGWLIRSTIENIDVMPGFACKSLIEWDLTHPDIGAGVTEVGVPDGITFNNISNHYSQNSSYTISYTGDGLGTGSRAGSTEFFDIYNDIFYPHSYTAWGATTTDIGTIRIDTVHLGGCHFSSIYSPTQAIRMIGTNPQISTSIFDNIYCELNYNVASDFQSILRGGTFTNCIFNSVAMYSQNLSLTAAPRYFASSIFQNCTFHSISTYLNDIVGATAPDDHFIELAATSYGCRFTTTPIWRGQPPSTPGLPWVLKRMTVNVDTRLDFLSQTAIIQKGETAITANGSYLLGSVPSSITQINAHLSAALSVRGGSAVSGTFQLRLSGGGLNFDITGPSVAATFSAGAVRMNLDLLGRADVVTTPTYNQFSTNAAYSFETVHNGSAQNKASIDAIIQWQSGSYDLYLDVSGLTGGNADAVDLNVEYGYSREYVNIV